MSGFRHIVRLPARWITAGLIALALTLGSAAAWAMRVSPMVAEMSTTGATSSARIEVGNVGSAALPFETTITRLDTDAEGNFVEVPDEENFLVFPPQGVVGVNGRQVVRVQWVGQPDIETSKAYYLSVKQLPVPTDGKPPEAGGSVNVTVLYTMKALLIVAPPGSEPKVEVVSAKPAMLEPGSRGEPVTPDAKPEPGIEAVIANTGTRYALMSGATWIVEGTAVDGQAFRRSYNSSDLDAALGVGYVPPAGGRRTFKIPTDGVELDPAKPIAIRFAR